MSFKKKFLTIATLLFVLGATHSMAQRPIHQSLPGWWGQGQYGITCFCPITIYSHCFCEILDAIP